MNGIPITADERFLFRSAPAFDLAFRPERFVSLAKVLRPSQLNRTPLLRVAFNQAGLMCSKADFQIFRMPDVIGPVGTLQHVCPKAHGGPSRRAFVSLRSLSPSSG